MTSRIAPQVQLEPHGAPGRLGDLLDRAARTGRQRVDRSRVARGAGGGELAVGVSQAGEAGRTEPHG